VRAGSWEAELPEQAIGFLAHRGVRVAYAIAGSGPVLLLDETDRTHLDLHVASEEDQQAEAEYQAADHRKRPGQPAARPVSCPGVASWPGYAGDEHAWEHRENAWRDAGQETSHNAHSQESDH